MRACGGVLAKTFKREDNRTDNRPVFQGLVPILRLRYSTALPGGFFRGRTQTPRKGVPRLSHSDPVDPPTAPANARIQEFFTSPERSLIRLSIPITIGMGIHILYSIVDMIFVGRLGGDAIAAVTFSGSFFFFMFSLSSISVGAQALIAQRVGAGDRAGASQAATHAILLGTILGIVFSSPAGPWPPGFWKSWVRKTNR
jgi:hypothetical protein